MSRDDRRAEQKLRKRRVRWLEKERKRDKVIDKIVAQMEEDFDEGEVDNAKAFVVDYLTDSGPFSQLEDGIDSENLDRICGDYDLEPADGIYILDILEDVFSTEKGEGSKTDD